MDYNGIVIRVLIGLSWLRRESQCKI